MRALWAVAAAAAVVAVGLGTVALRPAHRAVATLSPPAVLRRTSAPPVPPPTPSPTPAPSVFATADPVAQAQSQVYALVHQLGMSVSPSERRRLRAEINRLAATPGVVVRNSP